MRSDGPAAISTSLLQFERLPTVQGEEQNGDSDEAASVRHGAEWDHLQMMHSARADASKGGDAPA